jgi:methyltransferase-like protein
MHTQFLHNYDLDKRGFGLKELDSLWNTFSEITLDNNISTKEGITKFLSDIERHYSNKLRFEDKVESQRNELNKLYQEEARLRTELLSLPQVALS